MSGQAVCIVMDTESFITKANRCKLIEWHTKFSKANLKKNGYYINAITANV